MDTPPLLTPLAPRHFRFYQRSPSPSPTRQRLSDDLLSDLSPSTTLEAFTTPSGKLRTSVEAASPTERAFGIRATLASKKIQEWLDELSTWPWPADRGSAGFETPAAKRRKVSITPLNARNGRHGPREEDEEQYVGSLLAQDVIRYETRVEEIREDMDELDVEEIKTKVLDTFSAKSRPSSPRPNQPMPSLFASYTRMDDFTVVVTATVLRALPDLSRLTRLMDVWSIRLTVLRKVPPLLHALDDAEIALKSGWDTVEMFNHTENRDSELTEKDVLTRPMFEIMRDVLQDKVTLLGQELDFMLDTLEGREDTLPDSWLDRMEVIEQEYGNWVVSGDRKVREGEWARSAHARKMAEDERRARAEQAAAALAEKRLEEQETEKANELAFTQPRIAEEQSADEEATIAPERTTKEQPPNANSESLQDFVAGAIITIADGKQVNSNKNVANVNQDVVTMSPIVEDRSSPILEQHSSDLIDVDSQRPETDSDTNLIDPKTQDDYPAKSTKQEPSAEATASNIVPATIGAVTGTLAASIALLRKESDEDNAATYSANSKSTASSLMEALEDEETGNDQSAELIPTSNPAESLAHFHPAVSNHSSVDIQVPMTPEPRSNSVARALERRHSTPHTPVPASPSSRAMTSRNGHRRAESGSPVSLSKVPRFGHALANTMRRSMSQQSSFEQDISTTPKVSPRKSSLKYDQENLPQHIITSVNGTSTSKELLPSLTLIGKQTTSESSEIASEDDQSEYSLSESDNYAESTSRDHVAFGSATPKAHRRNAPSVTLPGYGRSSFTPTHEAEPGEYFQPTLSPIRSPSEDSFVTDPDFSFAISNFDDVLPSIETSDFLEPYIEPLPSINGHSERHSDQFDGSFASKPERRKKSEHSLEDFTHETDHKSVMSASSSYQDLVRNSEDSRPDSIVSESSTVLTGQPGSGIASPDKDSFDDTVVSTPASDAEIPQGFPEIDISSPSAGRMGTRGRFYDRSPSGTPEPAIRISRHLFNSPAFTPSPEPDSQGSEPPLLGVHISTPSALSSPTKSHSTDDQMQQQISSLLETLPAKIHLTTEPDTTPPATYSVRSKKSRASLTPNYPRSHSSMSTSRSPTPFLTLAPAYAKNPRTRTNNANPEIKLYHLSRSTGEAPIKLFVRLVGENGERVMVRVGGGWADLGEYLKEYAAHHGRRPGSGVDPDNLGKVEIQDLPPRMISSGSVASIRGGRDSPAPRPASAMERPASSMKLRKTRKSLGVADEISSSLASLRSPSTPVQAPLDRSSSRLGWTEDEGASLGLAGPNSKRKEQDLSAENVVWVESMKEKVRQASAEKEKKAREKERKEKFGELDKIGGTKRLFPKG